MATITVTPDVAAQAHRDAAKAHREHPNSEIAQDATDDAAECTHHLSNRTQAIEDADDAALDACWDKGDSKAAAEAHDLAASEIDKLKESR